MRHRLLPPVTRTTYTTVMEVTAVFRLRNIIIVVGALFASMINTTMKIKILIAKLVQQAALGQREIMYVSVAPACLGLACGLAMGTLGLIGCYKIDNVNRYSNIDFPDICIQAEETLLVKEYNIWNIIYNVFSIFQVGAFFGSLLTVCLRNVIGPKSLCQLSSFALFIGSITACIAKEQLFILSIVSKLTSSIGIGVCVVSVPIFVVESSTVKTRGSVCGLFQLCFFLGISISLFLKYRLYYDTINEHQKK